MSRFFKLTAVATLLCLPNITASDLVFDRDAHRLSLRDKTGKEVGTWEAWNNVVKTAKPFPSGSWTFSHPAKHVADPDGPYGNFGNLVFNVKDRSGMGIHSGRKNKDGPKHPTEGCIRTTDEAMKTIMSLHKVDPLKTLAVRP